MFAFSLGEAALGYCSTGCVRPFPKRLCCFLLLTCDEYALKPVWFLDLTQNKKRNRKNYVFVDTDNITVGSTLQRINMKIGTVVNFF
jgi:hypothetical protein